MASPLNSWSASVKAGATAEVRMIDALEEHLGWIFVKHPNGTDIDLVGGGILDIKALRCPYPSSPTPSGLTPATHLTLDYANVFKYSDSALIVMAVDYTAAEVPTKGVYYISAGRVKEIIQEHPGRVYSRSSRSRQDKVKKIGISTDDAGLIVFPGMTIEQSADLILTNREGTHE